MSKKIFLLAAVLAVASCAAEEKKPMVRYCPNVQMAPAYTRLTQTAGRAPESKVELIGYEGYCRRDIRNQTQAVIAPVFEISRLNETSAEAVKFSYYIDTGDNKSALIGKQTYPVDVKIPTVGEKVMYQGDYVTVRIPDDQPGFPIEMGLVLSDYQYRYNRMHGLK